MPGRTAPPPARGAASRPADTARRRPRGTRPTPPAPRPAPADAATRRRSRPRPTLPRPTSARDDSHDTPLAFEGVDPRHRPRAPAAAAYSARPGRHHRAARAPSAVRLRYDHRRAPGGRSVGGVRDRAHADGRVRRALPRPYLPGRSRAPPPDAAPGHERTYRILGGGGR